MLLGDEQHVPVVFDLLKCLQAVLVVLYGCLVIGSEFVGLSPQQGQDSSVPEGDLPGGRDKVDPRNLKDIEGVDEDLLLLLESLGSQGVLIDLDVAVVVVILRLLLRPLLDVYFEEVGVPIHELLCF